MIFGSVCSGIEAASVAWHPLGWRASFLSEIEAFPRAVLAHHYPDVPLHGDFTTILASQYEPIDLLVGGTPCQSFSVTGLRGGLDDDRGNLALEYLRLADRLRPRWLVWENVPGVLSSNGGRDFGAILGVMVELGYGVAYRVLDAQFFGVAQRRRRVFVVGYAGDWRRAAAVLFERHSLSGHPAPRREKGQSAPTIPSRSTGGGGLGTDLDCDGGLIQAYGGGNTSGPVPVAAALAALAAHGRRQDFEVETFVTQPITLMERGRNGSPNLEYRQDGTANAILTPNGGRGGLGVGAMAFSITPSNSNRDYNAREVEKAQALNAGGNRPSARGGDLIVFSAKDHGADAMADLSPTLRAGGHAGSHANAGVMPAVAFTENQRNEVREFAVAGALSCIRRGDAKNETLLGGSAVRRLTPRECERLQGFPDDYTLIPWRKGMAPDGPRYKALGNSMAVPVMRWIGERIAAVEAVQTMERAA